MGQDNAKMGQCSASIGQTSATRAEKKTSKTLSFLGPLPGGGIAFCFAEGERLTGRTRPTGRFSPLAGFDF